MEIYKKIIYSDKNKEEAEKLYKYLSDNNISALIDDRENLNLGNKINDVYVSSNFNKSGTLLQVCGDLTLWC